MNDEAGIYDDLIITKIEQGFLIILMQHVKIMILRFYQIY